MVFRNCRKTAIDKSRAAYAAIPYKATGNRNYSIAIASTGQQPTQAPQSTQSLEITALPSAIFIASTGHSPTHDSQPVHFSTSTIAAIFKIS
jgi:hypothetical protein